MEIASRSSGMDIEETDIFADLTHSMAQLNLGNEQGPPLETFLNVNLAMSEPNTYKHQNKFFTSLEDHHSGVSDMLESSLQDISMTDITQSLVKAVHDLGQDRLPPGSLLERPDASTKLLQIVSDRGQKSNLPVQSYPSALPTISSPPSPPPSLLANNPCPASLAPIPRSHAPNANKRPASTRRPCFPAKRSRLTQNSPPPLESLHTSVVVERDISHLERIVATAARYHEEVLASDTIAVADQDEQVDLLDTISRFLTSSAEVIQDIERRDKYRRAKRGVEKVEMGHNRLAEAKQIAKKRLEGLQGKISVLYTEWMVPTLVEAPSNHRVSHIDAISQIICLLGVICHVIRGFGTLDCTFIIMVASLLVKMTISTFLPGAVGGVGSSILNEEHETLLHNIPKSLRAALRQFDIDGKFILYAVCPECNFTHKEAQPGNPSSFPERCVNTIIHSDSQTPCNTVLLRSRRDGTIQPIKSYLVGSLGDHLARNLNDPTFLSQSNRAADEAYAHIKSKTVRTEVHNVFDATFLSTFPGSRSSLHIDRGNEIHLAYALHADFFNPNGNRKRGNHDSVGIISAVNLALDSSIRYLPEYVFMGGVVPGPREPTLEQMDYFSQPIVEQFAESWKRGHRVTQTADDATFHMSHRGTVVRTAIALSANDLPAARKMSGLQGVSSHFLCSVCTLHGRSNIMCTDHSRWIRRDIKVMREKAEAWRDAKTGRERDAIYKEHGVRWSCMWLLDYWDPTRMLVIDGMHCLLEGLVHYHCRHVLRLDSSTVKSNDENLKYSFDYPWDLYDGSDSAAPQVVEGELSLIGKGQDILRIALVGERSLTVDEVWTRLDNQINLGPLKWLAYSLQRSDMNALRPEIMAVWQRQVKKKSKAREPAAVETQLCPRDGVLRKKAHFIALLLDWRLDQPHQLENYVPQAGSANVLRYIRRVINETKVPSSVNSVPSNYGDANAGSIKADEWRTLSSIYLPIALVALWGGSGCPVEEQSKGEAEQLDTLDHTMALFQACIIACSFVMTNSRIEAYREHHKYWVDNLHRVHPHTKKHAPRQNIHAAGHIYDFLLLFGPILSWWCFSFERLIGALQKINTSNHIGGV